MARELLELLLACHAFNPRPSEDWIGRLHVPFDRLTQSAAYETALAESVRRGERVALIGATGSGKSSLTAHVLRDHGVRGTAALRVPVATEDTEVSTNGAAFCAHLVRTVRRLIYGSATRTERQQVDAAAQTAFGVNGGSSQITAAWRAGPAWLQGEVQHELRGATEPIPHSGDEVIDQAEFVLQIIAARGVRPVLVLDDTDHWLRRPGLPDPEALIAGFFGEVVRVVAERLSIASAVVKVHRSYLAHPTWQFARGFLETSVELPVTVSTTSLIEIIENRAHLAADLPVRRRAVEIIDQAALEALHANYADGDQSLRTLMRNLHTALMKACGSEANTIGIAHLDQAID